MLAQRPKAHLRAGGFPCGARLCKTSAQGSHAPEPRREVSAAAPALKRERPRRDDRGLDEA